MPELINCRVCGHQISTSAKSCPNCGDEISFTEKISEKIDCGIGLEGFFYLQLGNFRRKIKVLCDKKKEEAANYRVWLFRAICRGADIRAADWIWGFWKVDLLGCTLHDLCVHKSFLRYIQKFFKKVSKLGPPRCLAEFREASQLRVAVRAQPKT